MLYLGHTKERVSMDRQTLLEEVKQGPIRVFMNDGSYHDIPSVEHCLVDQIAARVLYRDDSGIWRTKVLALVCMSRIEHLVAQA